MKKIKYLMIAIMAICGAMNFTACSDDDDSKENNYIIYQNAVNKMVKSQKKNSKVIVVEYADLQCPGCATMMPYMTRIYQKYDDRVAFVFRHFPIKGHLNARSAAAAAESAGRQGKYWEMLEALFSRRSEWTSVTGQTLADTYAKIFKAVCPDGDEKQFRTDMSDTEIAQKIDFDYNIGLKNSKVTMTPSIYVNGKLVDITRAGTTFNDIENNIKDMIEEELSK